MKDFIGLHLKNHLLHEADEVDTFLDSIKTSLSKAKGEFRDFINKVMNDEVENVDNEDVVKSLKTTATGSALMKDSAFNARVGEVASTIGVPANALMKVMNMESGLNPEAVNAKTKATGLIQFMPKTAERLGTSVNDLKSMSALEQLDYVEKYYQPYKGKVRNYVDLYMVTFFPAALGKSDDTVLRTKTQSAELISKQNPAIAKAAGKTPGEPLTVGDFKKYARGK